MQLSLSLPVLELDGTTCFKGSVFSKCSSKVNLTGVFSEADTLPHVSIVCAP
jgi:hypothetical protein